MGDHQEPEILPESMRRDGSPVRAVVLAGLVVLIGAASWGWTEYTGPKWTWRREIHGTDAKAKADLWARVRRERAIDGLDRSASATEVSLALDDADAETRGQAVETLPSLLAEPTDAIARIAGRLGDPDAKVRASAATALGEVFQRGGAGQGEALVALKMALKDADPTVRRAAVASIGQVVFQGGISPDPLLSGRFADPALDLVDDRLLDDDMSVRVEAACVLAANRRGADAVPMLINLVKSQPTDGPLPYLADRAILALELLTLQSDEAAAFLDSQIAVVREGYPERPRDALARAALRSPEAHSRVRHLAARALRAADPSIKHNAAILMADINQGMSALPEIIDALNDPSTAVRLHAVGALADLGDADPSILPALKAATNDPDREVRESAFGAIEAIELDAEEMMP